jgi:serine phosphatase RsbU (regulator of sigma subunit)
MRHDLWHVVDELILAPVHRVELEGRVASLLKVRHDSVELKRRNEELETFVYDLSESFESVQEEEELATILVTRALSTTRARAGAVVSLEGPLRLLASTATGTDDAALSIRSEASLGLKNRLRAGPLSSPEACQALGGDDAKGATVIAPVTIKREPVAALVLQKPAGASFSPGDIRLIESMNTPAGVFLHNLRQAHRLVEMAHLQEQIGVAEMIQQQLQPTSNASVPGLESAALYLATNQIGGDYYDVLPLARNKIAAVIADVSGHSIASGLLMMAARSATRLLLRNASGPADVLGRLNDTLYMDLDRTGLLISLALLILDMDMGVATFANAGHNPPLWFRQSCGDVRELDATGLLLGILPETTYDEVTFSVASGDAFVFYTDGITEARQEHGRMFGENRLRDLVQRTGRGTAAHITDAIKRDVDRHTQGQLTDDVTALVLKLTS